MWSALTDQDIELFKELEHTILTIKIVRMKTLTLDHVNLIKQ